MLGKLFESIFAERQRAALAAGIAAAVIILLGLVIGTVALWLLGWLWRVAELSPFGIWGFAGVVVVASAVGGVVAFLWIRRPMFPGGLRPGGRGSSSELPHLSSHGRELVENWTREVAGSKARSSQSEPDTSEQKPIENVDGLKGRIIHIVKSVTLTPRATENKAALASAERYLSDLEQHYPDQKKWAAQYRGQIERLKNL